MMQRRFVAMVMCFVVACAAMCYAKGGSSSSRSSSSSSGSSRGYSSGSSSSSKPSYSSGSSSKPSSTSKYSSGASSKPSSTSKYSSGASSDNKPSSSKYSAPSSASSRKPSDTKYTTPTSAASVKPESAPVSAKAKANMSQAATRKYVETQKATAPPKESYTSNGKTVRVDSNSTVVKSIRDRPSTYYTPVQREQRTNVYVTNNSYSHPYSWYCGQPSFYVGGGYSPVFWYMMMEWSAERRAQWLYHHQSELDHDAYMKGLQDAKVAAEVQKLEAAKVARDANYVDASLKGNEDIMYTQEHVEAAYNPEDESGSGLWWFLGILIFVGCAVSVVVFVLTKRFGR